MGKKCVFCGREISASSVIDFCESCGQGSFGSKMFKAIIENMERAKSRGDLDQSQVE